MKPKKKLLPVDIELPERVLLEGDVMFVTLRTLDEFEQFWNAHKNQFAFACESGLGPPVFLRPYEWVFGNSKAAIVRTIMRWGRSGISCEFYRDPFGCRDFFMDRELDRKSRIEGGDWSDEDEAEYLADCVLRSPETYFGYWRFCNLPDIYSDDDWFFLGNHEELFDQNMPLAEVENKLHEQTFDEWENCDGPVMTYSRDLLDKEIQVWVSDRADGKGW